jgi:hypothetical protein
MPRRSRLKPITLMMLQALAEMRHEVNVDRSVS